MSATCMKDYIEIWEYSNCKTRISIPIKLTL